MFSRVKRREEGSGEAARRLGITCCSTRTEAAGSRSNLEKSAQLLQSHCSVTEWHIFIPIPSDPTYKMTAVVCFWFGE